MDTLLILTDTSHRSFQTADVIQKVARQRLVADENERMIMGQHEKNSRAKAHHTRLSQNGLIINRVRDNNDVVKAAVKRFGMEILGCMPEDENITAYDLTGRPIIDIPETSLVLEAVRQLLRKIGILQ